MPPLNRSEAQRQRTRLLGYATPVRAEPECPAAGSSPSEEEGRGGHLQQESCAARCSAPGGGAEHTDSSGAEITRSLTRPRPGLPPPSHRPNWNDPSGAGECSREAASAQGERPSSCSRKRTEKFGKEIRRSFGLPGLLEVLSMGRSEKDYRRRADVFFNFCSRMRFRLRPSQSLDNCRLPVRGRGGRRAW